MLSAPFPLLRQFASVCDIRFLRKEDSIQSDSDIAKIIDADCIVGLRQEHGSHAVVVRSASSRTVGADALATDTKGITLTIRFADCQNAVLIVPEKRVIALVHAGWRGVRSHIFSSTMRLLQSEWGIRPPEVWAGLGPALCTKCADFTDPAREVPELARFIQGRCIDLRAALDQEMMNVGIPASQIERMPDCTRCDPQTYFTYRGGDRDRVQNGFVNCLTVRLV